MTILALDIATKTGWACSNGKSGTRDFSEYKEDYGHLGAQFGDWLGEVIEHHHVRQLVIERGFFRGPASFLLSRLVFQAHVMGWGYNCKRHEFTPGELKKWATGKGNATKAEMMEAARSKGLPFADDNEADAQLLLAYYIAESMEKERDLEAKVKAARTIA